MKVQGCIEEEESGTDCSGKIPSGYHDSSVLCVFNCQSQEHFLPHCVVGFLVVVFGV